MSDAVLEAISPVSTMAIFVAPRQLIKKFFEKLFTMDEVKEAYHAHTLTHIQPSPNSVLNMLRCLLLIRGGDAE